MCFLCDIFLEFYYNISGDKIKIIFTIFVSFLFTINVNAEKLEVSLEKCVDGDTAWFIYNNEKIKARFLAIDTPESTNKKEPFGKEASDFTCNMLINANKIEIEYDPNSDKLDKYDRHLVWVFVYDTLLQNLIIKNGLGKVAYLYDDYKYTNTLENSELIAKANRIGIWNETNDYLYVILGFILFIIILIISIFNKKVRKKFLNRIIKKL